MAKRKRKWTHKSVLSLLNSCGGDCPETIIRDKAKELIASAKSVGWSGPPFNPLQLASMQGIKCREATGLFSAEAQLTPVAGRQLLLEFNPDRAESRRNYSICHEIVHTFFDDCYEMVHFRKTAGREFDPEYEVEHLCQVGAAELLMPEEDFIQDLANVEFSLRSLSEIATRYGASREAALRRMVALGPSPTAAVFLSRRLKPEEKLRSKTLNMFPDLDVTPVPKLRILYGVYGNGFPIFLPQHKSVPDDSCVNVAANTSDAVVAGLESWNLAEFGQRRIEAIGLPTPLHATEDNPCVAALIFA